MKTNSPKGTQKRSARIIFEGIRKPLPQPGHPLGRAKPEERVHPSMRKAKHKRPPGDAGEESSGD